MTVIRLVAIVTFVVSTIGLFLYLILAAAFIGSAAGLWLAGWR